jgi:hypothetical protein
MFQTTSQLNLFFRMLQLTTFLASHLTTSEVWGIGHFYRPSRKHRGEGKCDRAPFRHVRGRNVEPRQVVIFFELLRDINQCKGPENPRNMGISRGIEWDIL